MNPFEHWPFQLGNMSTCSLEELWEPMSNSRNDLCLKHIQSPPLPRPISSTLPLDLSILVLNFRIQNFLLPLHSRYFRRSKISFVPFLKTRLSFGTSNRHSIGSIIRENYFYSVKDLYIFGRDAGSRYCLSIWQDSYVLIYVK